MPLLLLLIAVGAVGGLTAYFVTHPGAGDLQAQQLQASSMVATLHMYDCSTPQGQAAVAAFQKVAGLPVNGCYDGRTAEAAQYALPAGTLLPMPCSTGAAAGLKPVTVKNRWGGLRPLKTKGG